MNSDIFTTAWQTTYQIISGNVPDPSTRNKKWIWQTNPLIGSPTDPKLSYPIIIIDAFVIPSSNPLTFGNTKIDTDLGTTIEVHDSSGGARFDGVCGSLIAALWNNTKLFASSGLGFMEINGGHYDQIVISRDNRVHIKSFGLGFKKIV